jgi:hypothetical protein
MAALPTNQGQQQASVRAVTGSAQMFNGDWMQLFDDAGIPSGFFDGRLLAWINQKLAASYGFLPQAMQAFAESEGYYNWSSMGTFDAS